VSTIFISHSSEDNAWAERIRDWLEGSANKQHPKRQYQSLFLDFDPKKGIAPGRSWRETLYEKLQLCRAVIVICSAAYGRSEWCLAELGVAMASGKLVLPVRIDKSPPPRLLSETQNIKLGPTGLEGWQQLELLSETQHTKLGPTELEGWQRLERSLEALSWQERLDWPPKNEPHASPFPGLACFERKHAPVFFGQDQTLRQAQAKVETLTASASRFLLILGASGCGKSSLLRAGLVPWLAGAVPGRWIVLDPFRPGRKPFHWLDVALNEAFQAAGQTPPSEPARTAKEIGERLEKLRIHTRQQDARVVIAIDQFEELLGRGDEREDAKPTEADDFLSTLAELLKLEGSRVLILATLRSDCLGSLQLHPSRLNRLAGDPILLGPMDVDGFRQVIEGPQRVGVRLETGLSDRLVDDTPSGDVLPLLAFTLQELWDGQADGAGLTLQQYDDFGGLAGAVQRKADEVLTTSGATEEEIQALERAFIDHLVRLTSDGQAAKQPARLEALPAASRRLVKLFVEARLLVSGKGSDGAAVEIAHEALLRTWPKLVGWIDTGREELLQRVRVRRLGEDLSANAPERQRRQALEALAALAASGGAEAQAVEREGAQPLADLLAAAAAPEADREDAALVLALIGLEEPLQRCLGDTAAPVALRRRAAESLGLLAKRSNDQGQRVAIAEELERWLREYALDVRIEGASEPIAVIAAQEAAQQQVATPVSQALAADQNGKMAATELHQRNHPFEKQITKVERSEMGSSHGWADHDALLPLLQGASRGLQLAASVDLPLLGSGKGSRVSMLTLQAHKEDRSLRISTKIVEIPVWKLPLPGGQFLEMVIIPKGTYTIGRENKGQAPKLHKKALADPATLIGFNETDPEQQREVHLDAFAVARHPITQAQWQAVVEYNTEANRELSTSPGIHLARSLWDTYAQPGDLPIDSVTWEDCKAWLSLLQEWINKEQHLGRGTAEKGDAPQLYLPSESQWEAACSAWPHMYHFGDAIDTAWANYDGGNKYVDPPERQGVFRRLPVITGFFGLVNKFGLADMHGQYWEWCTDQWHPNPIGKGWPENGDAWQEEDPIFKNHDTEQKDWKVLRGGSWFVDPMGCRGSLRRPDGADLIDTDVGFRPCCNLPLFSHRLLADGTQEQKSTLKEQQSIAPAMARKGGLSYNSKPPSTKRSQPFMPNSPSNKSQMDTKTYLKDRIDKQLDWLSKSSQKHKRGYMRYRISGILLGALVTVLAPYAGTKGAFSKWVPPILQVAGAGVGIASSLLALNQHQENWLRYRILKESLEREKMLFLTGSQDCYTVGEADAFHEFVRRTEAIMAEERSTWSNQVADKAKSEQEAAHPALSDPPTVATRKSQPLPNQSTKQFPNDLSL
jgi:formylglycine-generating enzyme required for sulfatase activity